MTRLVVALCLIAACDGTSKPAPPTEPQPSEPAQLAADVASGLLITDVEQPPHRIGIPPELFKKGVTVHSGRYEVCVDPQGAVADVTVVQTASPRNGRAFPGAEVLDSYWMETVKGWQYRPHQVNGHASAFCYVADLEAPRQVLEVEVLVPSKNPPPMRLSDVTKPPHRPTLPQDWTRSSFIVWGLYKLCLEADGRVMDIVIIKPADAMVDPGWLEAMRTWRYQTPLVDGQPAAACHSERIEVRVL